MENMLKTLGPLRSTSEVVFLEKRGRPPYQIFAPPRLPSPSPVHAKQRRSQSRRDRRDGCPSGRHEARTMPFVRVPIQRPPPTPTPVRSLGSSGGERRTVGWACARAVGGGRGVEGGSVLQANNKHFGALEIGRNHLRKPTGSVPL